MRIRKNAKLSPLLFSSHASAPEVLQTHVCQLNQSPWDVIPFPQPDTHHHQTEGEDSFTGNGSLGDSVGAVESSVASMMDMSEEKASVITVKAENMAIIEDDNGDDDNYTIKDCNSKVFDNNNGNDQRNFYCQKNDGKGWQCKKLAKPGHSFCEHHLSLVRSSYAAVSSSKKSAYSTTALNADAGTRRLRGRTKKGTSSTSNPYEYYYYSGFGPLWGRKRGGGDKGSESKVVVDNSTTSATNQTPSSTPSSSSQIDTKEFDYVDDDDVDDDEDDDDCSGGDTGKKRVRKPVKARSLKSLM